jgi:hypothetical protein
MPTRRRAWPAGEIVDGLKIGFIVFTYFNNWDFEGELFMIVIILPFDMDRYFTNLTL